MEANKEEAAKALELGKRALAKRDLERAAKFISKSLQLFETKEARVLLNAVQQRMASGGGDASESTESKSSDKRSGDSKRPDERNRPQNGRREAEAPQRSGADEKKSAGKGSSSDDAEVHVRRVMKSVSFYEVLDVPKDVSAEQLKKAYRKVSLRVHPDKNTAPGAVAAFQRVTEAFDVLSDERKRQIYDQVGHDRFSQQVREGRPGGAPDRRAHGHAADFTPEELFEMFFSNAMRGGFNANRNANFSTFRFRRNQPEDEVNGASRFAAFAPFLLMLFIWGFWSMFTVSPLYSLSPSSAYNMRRETSHSASVPYYVQSDFGDRVSAEGGVRKVEDRVRAEYLQVMHTYCKREEREREAQLFWASSERRREVMAQKLHYCEEYMRVWEDRKSRPMR